MNNNSAPASDQSASEFDTTGLPWPRSWRGAYLLVVGSFILWLVLLIALGEFCK